LTEVALDRINVIGAGSWGTALADLAARTGRGVTLWGRDVGVVDTINRNSRNPRYLPDMALEPGLRATTDMAIAADAQALLLAVPAQHMRAVCRALADVVATKTPVVICAKGIEIDSGALMNEVVAAALPGRPIAALSGPTFAAEVARGLPTAVTLACADAALAAALAEALGSRTFRPYVSTDLIGTLVGGAVKNVLAIACGIATGRRFGDNARAALITRGVAEIGRLGMALGGRPQTLMGLSGIGDIVLTCSSAQSRNFSFGVALGETDDVVAARARVAKVVEGIATARPVVAIARRLDIDMPLCTAVDQVLHHGAELDATIAGLMGRPFKTEQLS
jgi:glycerol-3-phosphate dehydrogenase (NAD(P)+)